MERKPKRPHPALQDVLTVRQAAELKGVAPTSIVRAIQRDDLAAVQREVGTKTFYLLHRRDVERWIPERRGRKRAPRLEESSQTV